MVKVLQDAVADSGRGMGFCIQSPIVGVSHDMARRLMQVSADYGSGVHIRLHTIPSARRCVVSRHVLLAVLQRSFNTVYYCLSNQMLLHAMRPRPLTT